MPGTLAFAAKRAFFDRLTVLAATGQPLAGRQVAYSWPGTRAERVCIYGGGVTFTQEQAAAEYGVLVREVVTVGVLIRVAGPGKDVRDTDAEVEQIADALGDALAANPELAGQLTYIGIASGQGDYQTPTEDVGAVSILALRVQIEGYLT